MRWATVIALAVASLPRLGALQISSLRSGSRLSFRLAASGHTMGKPVLNVAGAVADPLLLDYQEKSALETPPSQRVDQTYNDVAMLDDSVNREAQISQPEFVVLAFTAMTAALAPFLFGEKIVEVLVPTMGATTAAIGISAEYTGRVSMFNGMELAATTVQAASEAEYQMSCAERAKAIIPACVGISFASSIFALLAPALVAEVKKATGFQIASAFYLIWPAISVGAAAVASLAIKQVKFYVARAVAAGDESFVQEKGTYKENVVERFRSFVLATLPVPILASLCPGPLTFKAIVAATSGVAQTEYFHSRAEFQIARGQDAVALKARAAAVADAYASQGARSGSILPFTSSLAALCAAGTAAVVELLPLVPQAPLQALICAVFPALGSLIAAGASLSKARCEVDAEAAKAASDSFILATQTPGSPNSLLNPVKGTASLIQITFSAVSKTYWQTTRGWVVNNPGILLFQRAMQKAIGLGDVKGKSRSRQQNRQQASSVVR
eukprot:CAMPEP_0118987462 /NCGR_PEP_ID=MMETSP1173-20130426/44228_1 /TAXON_ID=1034831 /ORGANISM="Rhizochromulina marina cf, Strain CCMP1243" /LENGTH=498 /DNA_ID=CAMNT_0006938313 /DNA_START=22 /DNA_END=1518 /DNA_ORIENTATION=+